MTKSHAVAVTQLREAHVLLRAQAKEIASLRASTLLHVERIAEMQAELDVRPGTRAPRSAGIAAVTLSRASAESAVLESELNHGLGTTETSPSDRWFRHTEPARSGAPSKSSLRVWHRNHADRVIAEVAPVAGVERWRTGASREISRERDAFEGPSFALLVDAQAAADALAQSRFGHVCDGRCGAWHAAERRRTSFKTGHGSTVRMSVAADEPSGRLPLRPAIVSG